MTALSVASDQGREWLQNAAGSDQQSNEKLLMAGHYIEEGENLVLLMRKWHGRLLFAFDTEGYEKLTVEIRQYEIGTPISLPSKTVSLYYSEGGSAWIHLGAGAYASEGRGRIVITRERDGKLKAKLDILIDAKAAHRGYGDREVRIKGSYLFRKLRVGGLTPWLGLPNSPPYAAGYRD